MPRFARLALGLLIALAGAVAACGGSAAPTIPTLRTAGASPTAPISPEQALRAYVTCMRDHGIDMPDARVWPDGRVELQYPELTEKGPFMIADEACRALLVDAYPPTTPNPNAAQEQDQLLAYARCMREHGFDMPDDGSVTVQAAGVPEEADPSFLAADQLCARLLPGKPGSSGSPGVTGAPASGVPASGAPAGGSPGAAASAPTPAVTNP